MTAKTGYENQAGGCQAILTVDSLAALALYVHEAVRFERGFSQRGPGCAAAEKREETRQAHLSCHCQLLRRTPPPAVMEMLAGRWLWPCARASRKTCGRHDGTERAEPRLIAPPLSARRGEKTTRRGACALHVLSRCLAGLDIFANLTHSLAPREREESLEWSYF